MYSERTLGERISSPAKTECVPPDITSRHVYAGCHVHSKLAEAREAVRTPRINHIVMHRLVDLYLNPEGTPSSWSD
jgi:hypothetical protein